MSNGKTISPVRSLTTLVWLPKATGRWPLVVFAPGFQVGPEPYETMLEGWAEHGYVVAAPEFPLTDAALAGANTDESDIDNEPADVRFITDALVATGGTFAGHIDAARVAVAGHSDGGEVALAASGAPTPAGSPLYRAVIAMSVQPVAGMNHNPPVLVVQGDRDTINPPSLGYQTFERAVAPKYLLVLHGAQHLPPLLAGSPWLPGIEAETEAFLDVYVGRDGSPSGIRSAVAGSPFMSLWPG